MKKSLGIPFILFVCVLVVFSACNNQDAKTIHKTEKKQTKLDLSISEKAKKNIDLEYTIEKVGKNIEIKVTKNSSIILQNNPSLKSSLFMFLHANSSIGDKKRDYKIIYSVLSKEYLTSRFPQAESSIDYEIEMKESSDIHYLEYLSIENVEIIKEEISTITIEYSYGSEGTYKRAKTLMEFKLENENWKYNGRKRI